MQIYYILYLYIVLVIKTILLLRKKHSMTSWENFPNSTSDIFLTKLIVSGVREGLKNGWPYFFARQQPPS